jgi:phosphoribosylformylglycinamidine synthase I
VQAAVIVFPGSNCDRDVAEALTAATGHPTQMIWHRETELPKVDLVALPGGFSYGDYLRCGAMAARSPVMRAVVAKAKQGMPVLGVCNGFQILVETELLPGALLRNAGLRFVCKDVHLKVETSDSPFARGYNAGRVLRMPVAHGEGNYFADPDTLDRLEGEGRVAFRYVTPEGEPTAEANPNGSARNIAGIYSENRRVLGMMPHPERLADEAVGGTDGKGLFAGLVEALA